MKTIRCGNCGKTVPFTAVICSFCFSHLVVRKAKRRFSLQFPSHEKRRLRFFLYFLLLLCVTFPIWVSYVYTPPALTCKKFEVYNEVVKFVRNHRSLGNMRIHYGYPNIQIADYNYAPFMRSSKNELLRLLNEEDIRHVSNIASQLGQVGCNRFQSEGDMILFYTDKTFFMPLAPGVVYSMDGKDPNLSSNPLTNSMSPFIRIKGDWYASRKLIIRWHPAFQSPVPKSLIDLSSKAPSEL